ncbi:acetamidase/formamidase family protein [Variovorax sp. VNK109]|uniref:acetamidase/formamidase family protein n=1 Tax=Variovorax sp. VNK109 TaxID=3400919 RepID=UPI003C0AC0F7
MTVHHLEASKETVRVGVIDAAFEPVLAIDSGDEVVFDTWQLWGDAVTPDSDFHHVLSLRQAFKGKGPHSITGPIRINGAQPGMALRVDVLELRLRDYGFNVLLPKGVGRGLLKDEIDGGEIRHFKLDRDTMTTQLGDKATVQLRPFLGIMGVAPAVATPHISSVPGEFGGNMDCSELVEGTSLLLPVWVDGALFYAGDAHAAQGHGELNQTALESAFELVRLRITLLPQMTLPRPRILTATHVVTMGFHENLHEAARQATRDMIDLLVNEHGMTKQDAYVLCSLQVDLVITQIVNGNNGVHARLPRHVLASLSLDPQP